jgi:hypothetical protein
MTAVCIFVTQMMMQPRTGAGTDGCYWLVLAYTYDEFLALELSFSSNNRFADGFDDHCYGQSVRAVCK